MEFLNFSRFFSFFILRRLQSGVKIIKFRQFYSKLCNFKKSSKFWTKLSKGFQCFGVTLFFINGVYNFINIGSKPIPD